MAATTPFKPLFPAPNHLSQAPPSGSPLLFQQAASNMSTLNPLLQSPPISVSHLSSSFIQPLIRPPSLPSAFQAPQSAFTPLIPTNNQPSASLIQPKLTIGSAPPLFAPPTQPVPFPFSQVPPMPGMDTTSIPTQMAGPPPSFDKPFGQYESHFASTAPPPPPPLAPPPSTAVKDQNPPVPPPPQHMASSKFILLDRLRKWLPFVTSGWCQSILGSCIVNRAHLSGHAYVSGSASTPTTRSSS